jgi:hypothetical protein
MTDIEKIEKEREGAGNTDLPPRKQGPQANYWCFTYNNYDPDAIGTLEQVFKHECRWYVFQEEVGECGTPHLQGTLCLKVKQRLTQLKCIDTKISWRITKSCSKSLTYCVKAETATGNIYAFGIEIPKKPRLHEPRGWQLEVMEIIKEEADERTVHWFWEPDGGCGKSGLAKYLDAKHNALCLTGKSGDMFHMISKCPDRRTIILIDCPRRNQEYINYGAIEMIKNGHIFSGKYEGARLLFDNPHVICFANCEPDYSALSADRWHVVRINKDA